MKNYLLGRQAIYEFFTLVFYIVPDERLLKAIDTFIPVFEALEKEIPAKFSRGLSILKKCNDLDILSLNMQFTRLFLLGLRSVELKESRHRSSLNPTELILSVTLFYADNNIPRPSGVNFSIDSFPSELYFMFKMSEKTAESGHMKYMTQQRLFLEKHLLQWVPMFSSNVLKEAGEQGFYSAMVLLVEEFLTIDFKNLKEITESCQDAV